MVAHLFFWPERASIGFLTALLFHLCIEEELSHWLLFLSSFLLCTSDSFSWRGIKNEIPIRRINLSFHLISLYGLVSKEEAKRRAFQPSWKRYSFLLGSLNKGKASFLSWLNLTVQVKRSASLGLRSLLPIYADREASFPFSYCSPLSFNKPLELVVLASHMKSRASVARKKKEIRSLSTLSLDYHCLKESIHLQRFLFFISISGKEWTNAFRKESFYGSTSGGRSLPCPISMIERNSLPASNRKASADPRITDSF